MATLTAAADALENASSLVEQVLQSPEELLDPASSTARDIADSARSLCKVFFDAAQSCSTVATDLPSLVVHGFDKEQIWEELELQNVPLRRDLRRRVRKLASAPQGAIDLTLDAPAAGSTGSTARPEPAGGKAAASRKVSAEAASSTAASASKKRVPKQRSKGAGQEADAGAQDDDDAAEDAGDKGQDDGPLEDGFFKLEEMEKFADLAEGRMRLDEDADDSDFDMFEMDLNDENAGEDEDGTTARFDDFFAPRDAKPGAASKAPSKRQALALEENDDDAEGEDAEEEEMEGAGDDEDLSDEERALEAQIQKLQASGGTGDGGLDDDEGEEEEAAEDDEAEDEDGGATHAPTKGTKGKSLYEMDKRLRSLEEEVQKLEEEQLEEKHWSMRGEVSAKQRPLNSLLEVHLDQPMTHFATRRAEATAEAAGLDDDAGDAAALEDVPGASGVVKAAKLDIEAIIRQRVWDEDFDDVVRKAELPPSQRPQGADDDPVETLNFEKSRVGLGDIYAKQYEAEMLGHKTDAEKKDDKEKNEAKALFAKVMYKLDQMTNAHFTPRPPMLGTSGEHLAKVASVKMEETIPLMVSDAALKAPEEVRAPRRHDKERSELTHDERKALRGRKKTMRRRALEQKVESGEMTLKGMRERSEKLGQKNADAKKEKAQRGVVKESAKKRLRASELLEQASKNALGAANRKEEIRKESQSRPEGTPSAKRLKF